MPGTILGIKNAEVSIADMVPALMELKSIDFTVVSQRYISPRNMTSRGKNEILSSEQSLLSLPNNFRSKYIGKSSDHRRENKGSQAKNSCQQ